MRASRMLWTMLLVTGLFTVVTATAVAGHVKEVGGRPLTTTLTGAAEVGMGDPDGMGTANITVNPGQGTICYDIAVSDIGEVVGVHIHEAPVGVAGPVVVDLGMVGTGCVSVERELAKDIIKNPADYYINVHTPEFPAGAVRGQLST